MKRLRFLTALLLILNACSQNIIVDRPEEGSGEKGSVSIALTADVRGEKVATKAQVELPDIELPAIDDFRVAIYKEDNQMRLYNDSYANTKDKSIHLNAGDYRMVAKYGDSLGCGFDKAFFLAEPKFTVEGYDTKVEAEAVISNVVMKVEYGQTIKDAYSDYYTVVRHMTHDGKSVKFAKGETRYGFIPGGDVQLEVYVHDEELDGTMKWKYCKTEVFTYNPNDFVTFDITTSSASGKLTIKITVDDNVEKYDIPVEIPAYTTPQDAPVITPSGFEGEGNVHTIVEGVEADHTTTTHFVARGALAHCYLDVESEYFASKGLTGMVDLANLTSEQSALLKELGFDWSEDMLTSRTFCYVDFTGVVTRMMETVKAKTTDFTAASFILTVEDAVGKKDNLAFSIAYKGIQPTLDIKDYNVWARRIVSPVTSVNNGNINLLKLQYSNDNVTWTDFESVPVTEGLTHTYTTVPVEPATTYHIRSIYNGNENCVTPVLTFTTEAAAQLPNSGFESWTKATHSDDRGSRDWYQPWGDGAAQWWAVNSMKALNSTTTVWGIFFAEQNHRMVPTVSYSTDAHSGSASAHLFCVMTGDTVTEDSKVSGNVHVGELFSGTSAADGGRATESRPFASRPSAIKFFYKFAPQDNEKFYVKYELKDASGTVIASKEISDGTATSNWTEYVLPIEYSDVTKQAASISVIFKASSSDDPQTTKKRTIEFSGNNETGHIGSSFRIDDIELIYE